MMAPMLLQRFIGVARGWIAQGFPEVGDVGCELWPVVDLPTMAITVVTDAVYITYWSRPLPSEATFWILPKEAGLIVLFCGPNFMKLPSCGTP